MCKPQILIRLTLVVAVLIRHLVIQMNETPSIEENLLACLP